jgi:hypothetical protein
MKPLIKYRGGKSRRNWQVSLIICKASKKSLQQVIKERYTSAILSWCIPRNPTTESGQSSWRNLHL